jgi:uncharacterized protein YoxC
VAQVQLDVLYKVTGLQALKQSQAALNGAANAASAGTNKIRGYNAATQGTAVASGKAAAATGMAAKGYRATGFAAVGATGGVKSFGVALSAALGPIAAITGGLALISKTITVFSDRQRDVAVLTNGLKNLGLQGTPALDALQASADKLGKTTLFDQEQFTRGYALLTSFKQIGVSSYERVATAAADLAQTTGQDLNSALLQLSKALEDPARRVTDLSRSGTVFTEQQKEQIRVLQESGDILGAQAIILGEIEKQYGGAAEAAGGAGFAGAMDSAGESARDLGEAIGTIIVPALENFLKAITPVIENLAKFIKYVSQIPGVLGGIQGASGGLAGMFEEPAGDAAKLKKEIEETIPPVSQLTDQVREIPAPVKETADQMKELKAETEQTAEQVRKVKTETEPISDKVQKAVTEVQGLGTATSDASQEMASYAVKAGLSGDQAAQVAAEAMKIYQNTMNSSSAANTLAGAFAKVANEASRAASAAAGIGGGGGGGKITEGGGWTNNSTVNDKYKLDKNGNIVQRTDKERKMDAQRMKLEHLNKLSWDAEVYDHQNAGSDYGRRNHGAFTRGGMVGPLGSQQYSEFVAQYGSHLKNQPFQTINDAVNRTIHARMFADGGYVTGATQAVVGEGGEPEYIIPASKMDSAMQRYGSGMRGCGVIPESANVSVNYSGSTVDMGGTSYINKGDVSGIVSQAVNQTLSTIAKSPRARLGAGLR